MTPKQITEANQAAAEKVVAIMGGPASCARKLSALLKEEDPNAKTIRIGSVWSWIRRDRCGIPIKHILHFEALSGIQREQIRLDIPWRVCGGKGL